MISLSTSRPKLYYSYSILFIVAFALGILLDEKVFFFLPFVMLLIPVVISNPENLFFLLIASLPLSTEVQVTQSLGTDLPDEFIMIGLTGLLLMMIAYRATILNRSVLSHPLVFLLTLHLVWVAVSCVFSVDPILSIKYLLAKLWYVAPFVFCTLVFIRKKTIAWMVLLLVVPMFFVVLQALVRHAWVGFSFESVSKTVTPFFRNHVNYSAMLVCMVPMVWALHKHFSNNWKPWLKLVGIVFLAGILFSYSRGAWLALVIGGLLFYAIKNKTIEWIFLVSSIVLVAGFCLLGYKNKYIDYRPDFNKTIFHTDFAEHLSATYHLRDLSTAERFYRWIAAIRLSDDHLLTGVGPNNFYNSYKPYTVSAYKTWVSNNNDHSTVHNYFLLLLCEQGLPGMLIFITLLFGGFYYTQKIYHRSKDPLYKTVTITIGAILGMITTVNFLSDLIETDKIGSLFFLSIGVLVWIDIQPVESKQTLKP